MRKQTLISFLALIAGVLLITVPGCSKKSVQSGGDTQTSQQGAAKSGAPPSDFPSTARGDEGGGLKGLDSVKGGKSLSEERVGSGGTMVAKADTGDSASRQMEEIRREQAAAAAAGLRDVFFAYDSWTIGDDGRQSLMHDAEWIKSNPSAQLKVEGHCDERGTLAYNLVLGEKRAKAVRNYLVELGIGANRLAVVSYGKERPFCKEHAESCYQQNRRGHLVLRAK